MHGLSFSTAVTHRCLKSRSCRAGGEHEPARSGRRYTIMDKLINFASIAIGIVIVLVYAKPLTALALTTAILAMVVL